MQEDGAPCKALTADLHSGRISRWLQGHVSTQNHFRSIVIIGDGLAEVEDRVVPPCRGGDLLIAEMCATAVGTQVKHKTHCIMLSHLPHGQSRLAGPILRTLRQYGSSGNTSGLLRNSIPHGLGFSTIEVNRLQGSETSLNRRPRKTPDWRSLAKAHIASVAISN